MEEKLYNENGQEKDRQTKEVTKQMENVITIDGRGRPQKAKLLLELIEVYGVNGIMPSLMKLSERKWF